jgi:hypothetical protein
MSKRWFVVLVLSWSCSYLLGSVRAADEQAPAKEAEEKKPSTTPPAASAKAELAEGIKPYVGARLTLVVELRTPGTFATAPAFDLPRIPQTILQPPQERPLLDSETVDDVAYTKQRYELNLFVQRAGDLTIPPFTIRFEATLEPGKPPVDQRLTTPPVKLSATLPPGVTSSTVLVTPALRLTEEWQPVPAVKAVTVGSAFRRTITIESEDQTAMMLPPIRPTKLEGLAAYPTAPRVEDQRERGGLTARRIDSVTYVGEKPGEYELPKLSLAWWNSATEQIEHTELPGYVLRFAEPSPTLGLQENAPADPFGETRIWLGLGTLGTGMLGGGWYLARYLWRRRQDPEALRFADLIHACRAGDARTIENSLYAWLNEAFPHVLVPTLDTLTAAVEQPDLNKNLQDLNHDLFALPPAIAVPGKSWESSLRQARKQLLVQRQRQTESSGLPALNP